LSAAYIAGIAELGVSTGELWFAVFMLVNMNLIAAYSCYQLEFASRRAFLESRLLNELAQRDGLTGLYNRRSFDESIERMWRQSRREQAQLTIMLIDIDHFKRFNDRYGHQAGDDALKQVAQIIGNRAKRPLDFAARFGGEEFALVLYGPGRDYGQDLAEFLRTDVCALEIPNEDSDTGTRLTVSIGVALVSADGDRSLAGAIQMADEALYQAKEEGRDRVVVKDGARTQLQTGRFRTKRAV
jgi:diguanylate cyclase (GGDEF)-like protein